jgi:hypothetical protein
MSVQTRRSTRTCVHPEWYDPSSSEWVPGSRNQFSTHETVDHYDTFFDGSERETNMIIGTYDDSDETDEIYSHDTKDDSSYEPSESEKDKSSDDSNEEESEFDFSYETDEEEDDDSSYVESD